MSANRGRVVFAVGSSYAERRAHVDRLVLDAVARQLQPFGFQLGDRVRVTDEHGQRYGIVFELRRNAQGEPEAGVWLADYPGERYFPTASLERVS